MTIIQITDTAGVEGDLQLRDGSPLAVLNLQSLESATANLRPFWALPLDACPFTTASFGAVFTSPPVLTGGGLSLNIKDGVNAAILFSPGGLAAGSGLLDKQFAAANLFSAEDVYLLGFELDAALSFAVGAKAPSGFGLELERAQTPVFRSYTLFDKRAAKLPSLQTALADVVSSFGIFRSASDLRNQPERTLQDARLSGSVTIAGSYSLPLTVSPLSLATAKLPLGYNLNIEATSGVTLTGALTLSGDYVVRAFRATADRGYLGLYRAQGAELSVKLTARTGVSGTIDTTDVFAALLDAALPGIDTRAAGFSKPDADLIQNTLSAAIDNWLGVSVNAALSGTLKEEAAILYELDFRFNQAALDQAVDAALAGNWSVLAETQGATKLRDVVGSTRERTASFGVTLLGIYNYVSAAEFVRNCTVLHNPVDGTITITDQATAARVRAATAPGLADDSKLRSVMLEAFLATATFTAANAGGKLGVTVRTRQEMTIYKRKIDGRQLAKFLLLGSAVGAMTTQDVAQLLDGRHDFQHVRITASSVFEGEAALSLFFADAQTRQGRTLDQVMRVGRLALAALLDPNDARDRQRIAILTNDQQWKQLCDSIPSPASSPSYSDWYDIAVAWAPSIVKVSPILKRVLDSLDQVSGDPSKDQAFMTSRDLLARALAEVTRNTHAAFERTWPIATMYALAQGKAQASLEAQVENRIFRFPQPATRVAGQMLS